MKKRSSIIFSILVAFIVMILFGCDNNSNSSENSNFDNDYIEISYRDCGDYYAVEGPLSKSDNSSKVVIQEKINGKEVKEIDNRAFSYCRNLNKISIPSTVTTIGEYAFEYTGLTDITIPESVEDLDFSILYRCDSLKSIVVNEKNKKYDSRNNCNAIIETETNTLVLGCKSTIIPNTVINIGSFAFSYCENLLEITIPYGVSIIGNFSFENCHNLTTISIPNSVTIIGVSAFSRTNLSEITIPSSVEGIYIGGLFVGCDRLERIIVDENNKNFDSRNNCNAIIDAETNTLISGCKNTIIPNTVTSIYNFAFSYTDLEELVISSDIISIGKYVFTGCDKLERIIVDENNKTFDSRNNCNAIIDTKTNTLVLGCKNTIIPSDVTSIGDYAFDKSDLEELIIPSTVISIGREAFNRCSQLDEVYYLGTIDQWNSISIEEGNDDLISATCYIYSETQPTDITGLYWHYVDGVPTKW